MTTSPETTTGSCIQRLGRLVVIPSESFADYERVGLGSRLEAYYNPAGVFRQVYALSPWESGRREACGMTVLGGSLRKLGRLLVELRPDVVRAYGGFWASDFTCRHRPAGIPIVVSVHDPHPRMVHRSVACADLVLCTSAAVEETVLRRGADPSRLRRLPNRVRLEEFRPISDPAQLAGVAGQFPPGRYILHVGRKAHEKNLPAVIEALTFLDDSYKAVFVGRGNPRGFMDMAARLGVARRCFWVPSVPNEQLPVWFNWCHCMCTPSLWEGFGTVFIEAAACGAAIVTSNIAPMNTFLGHGTSAHLVDDYHSGRALAAAIARVCQDADYRRQICQGAIEAARPFEQSAVDALEATYYRQALRLGPCHVGQACRAVLEADWQWRLMTGAAGRSMRALRRARRRLLGVCGADIARRHRRAGDGVEQIRGNA